MRTERGTGGGSENRGSAETWFVSRHYDPRTGVWRGCTPKVPKLEGCSEPNPESFVGGGAHPITDL
jgi:hypothetical protein